MLRLSIIITLALASGCATSSVRVSYETKHGNVSVQVFRDIPYLAQD